MTHLREAAASGDRIKALAELRDLLATQLETAPPSYVAGMARQLTEVMRELASLDPPVQASPVDQIAAQAAKRRKKAAVPKRRTGGQ